MYPRNSTQEQHLSGRTLGVSPMYGMSAGRDLRLLVLVAGVLSVASPPLLAQAAPDSAAAGDTLIAAEIQPPGLPVFLTLGLGFGQRKDGCVLCSSPLDDKSFTGHLSLGRPLGKGIGVGVDVSAWRRGRPGTPGPADSTGVPVATNLSNMLGNASVTASYQVWHSFVRVGAGFAWGHQDLEELDEAGEPVVVRASGKGIGYSLGGGLMLPVHPMISLAVFGNWNAGRYDLSSVNGVMARDSQHRFYEVGFGLTLR